MLVQRASIWVIKVAKAMCHVVRNNAASVSIARSRGCHEHQQLTEIELGAGQNPFVKENDAGTHGNPQTSRD